MARSSLPIAIMLCSSCLFFCLLLTTSFIATAHTHHPGARHPIAGSEYRKKMDICAENISNGLWGARCKSSTIEQENCVLRCISVACYDKIYGDDPLEEGIKIGTAVKLLHQKRVRVCHKKCFSIVGEELNFLCFSCGYEILHQRHRMRLGVKKPLPPP